MIFRASSSQALPLKVSRAWTLVSHSTSTPFIPQILSGPPLTSAGILNLMPFHAHIPLPLGLSKFSDRFPNTDGLPVAPGKSFSLPLLILPQDGRW